MSAQIVWVTGASTGIGRAIAIEMAHAGWRVGLGSRNLERLQMVEQSIGSSESAAVCPLDVCDARSVTQWVHELRNRLGDPDVVVNCAGYGIFASAADTSEEDWDRTIDTNLKGLYLVTREVLPAMLDRGTGHFINVLSVAARDAFPKNTAYNASKFGALGFTEALRAEVRQKGIRVTSVLPGATDTPFWDRLGDDWNRERMMPPEDVARAVLHAAEAGPTSLIEEVRIAPPFGSL